MDPGHSWRSPSGPLVEPEDPRVRERRLALLLLACTLLSVSVLQSPSFAAVLLGVLAAHELAHRAVARAHGVDVSWPLFLPAPFFVGTLGAVIRFRSLPRSRSALVEIGASGPVAGAAVLALVLALRAASGPLPAAGDLGRPLLFVLAGLPATDADPVLYACWVGCLVTGMNLLPLGQLDGGHVWRGLSPGTADRAALAAGALAALLGLGWPWWWAWLGALALLGAWRPVTGTTGEVLPRTRVVGGLAAVTAALCLVPLPW